MIDGSYISPESEFWYNVRPHADMPVAGDIETDFDVGRVAALLFAAAKDYKTDFSRQVKSALLADPSASHNPLAMEEVRLRIPKIEYLVRQGPFGNSAHWRTILGELKTAISTIEWPRGSGGFYFQDGSTGRSRGEGNGVKPIKDAFCAHLESVGWSRETPVDIATLRQPGPIDVTKNIPNVGLVAAEWETGNISSSHRSVNKMALGLLNGVLVAGVVILPTRAMYRFLTDRIGNYDELSPYFGLWRAVPIANGVLAVIAIEHDGTRSNVQRIPKGTDGRALL